MFWNTEIYSRLRRCHRRFFINAENFIKKFFVGWLIISFFQPRNRLKASLLSYNKKDKGIVVTLLHFNCTFFDQSDQLIFCTVIIIRLVILLYNLFFCFWDTVIRVTKAKYKINKIYVIKAKYQLLVIANL